MINNMAVPLNCLLPDPLHCKKKENIQLYGIQHPTKVTSTFVVCLLSILLSNNYKQRMGQNPLHQTTSKNGDEGGSVFIYATVKCMIDYTKLTQPYICNCQVYD